MPNKEEVYQEIQRQIVSMIYKIFSLKSRYPHLTLLEASSKYKFDRYHWRKRDWIQELSEHKAKMIPYDIERSLSKFFNKHLMEPTLAKIIGMSGVKNPADVLSVFKYGSRVYGCITDRSDFDYVVITKTGPREERSIEREQININIISEDDFIKDLGNCEISALECWYLPEKHILKNGIKGSFFLDKIKLRHSISEKASHSFVKAKKKFIVPEDRNIYAGKKSLFHSLRIIDFGSQLAKLGKIEYYDAVNYLHKEIMENPSENWEDYQKKYKPLYNSMMTNFRKLAPKE